MKRWSVLSILCFSACASGPKPIPLALDPLNPSAPPSKTLLQERDALRGYLAKNPSDSALLEDAGFMLDAMIADSKVESAESAKLWFAALTRAKGSFGEKAFAGWIRSYVKQQPKATVKSQLLSQIMAELNGGSASPWMLDKGLTSEQKISQLIDRDFSDLLPADNVPSGAKAEVPSVSGIDPSDPLMIRLAANVCKSKSQLGAGWEDWQRRLDVDVRQYFTGLINQCSGQISKSVSILSEVVPRLAANSPTAPLALEAYARIIKMRRDQGERESVAPLYVPFMRLWKSPAISEASLGLTRNQFEQRRIEDTLWAARARAAIGDGESAKNYAEDVIAYVEAALSQSYSLTSEQKQSLNATLAETYHFLAFRLAVEARDWDKAASIAQLATERHSFSGEWSDRLRFSLGFYRFLAGRYEDSRKVWEEMLTDSKDDKLRPALLFWVSQAHTKLGNKSEASFYRKSVAQDHPLSFYSVVALRQSGSDYHDEWSRIFTDVKSLRKSLRDWQKSDLDDLRSEKKRGALLRRAEIFASLGMQQFSNYSLDDLIKAIDFQSMDEREMEWGLYISRLYAANSNWLGAIATTTKLTKDSSFWQRFPEQMIVYFPRPYASQFIAMAKEKDLSPEVLMGLTRQESSFRSDIRSGANAWGLMQLTPPTAKGLVGEAGFASPSAIKIPEDLLVPESNIRLGSTYVKQLNGRYAEDRSKVFAAYNAGIQTVENWVSRRLFEDQLVFIELIPYQETRDYVKGVWRNEMVYRFLLEKVPGLPN
jgi:soluble lytic murein transglycosylase-like protein